MGEDSTSGLLGWGSAVKPEGDVGGFQMGFTSSGHFRESGADDGRKGPFLEGRSHYLLGGWAFT